MTVSVPHFIANGNFFFVAAIIPMLAVCLISALVYTRNRMVLPVYSRYRSVVKTWHVLIFVYATISNLLLGIALEVYYTAGCSNSSSFQYETQVLARFVYQFLNSHNLPYWISFGNLLFVLRGYQRIPSHDTDSDVSMDKNTVLQQFETVPYFISQMRQEAIEKLGTDSIFIRYIHSRELIQLYLSSLYYGAHADIWLYHFEKGASNTDIKHTNDVISHNERKNDLMEHKNDLMVHNDRTIRAKGLPYDQIFPLLKDERVFLGVSVTLPRNASYLAEAEYGPEYKTPIVTRLECIENVWNGYCFYKEPVRGAAYIILYCILLILSCQFAFRFARAQMRTKHTKKEDCVY